MPGENNKVPMDALFVYDTDKNISKCMPVYAEGVGANQMCYLAMDGHSESYANYLKGQQPSCLVQANPLHYSKSHMNLAQLRYLEDSVNCYNGHQVPAQNEKNKQRRQYYHHRHQYQQENYGLKSKARFSATVPSNVGTVIRDQKLSFTPPSSPTAGSVGGGFPSTSGQYYYTSSSSGCFSKTSTSSYSSCSSTNSISPRKRRADENDVKRREGCRSSNSSGVESYCSCDKCNSPDMTSRVEDDAVGCDIIIPSGKRSKNDLEDNDVVFVCESPATNNKFSTPSVSKMSTSKNGKKTRKNYKKAIPSTKTASPFAIPYSVSVPKPQVGGYFLRSSAKDQKQDIRTIGEVGQVFVAPVINQRQISSYTSVEKSIQNLAINPSSVDTYQTRSKVQKASTQITVPKVCTPQTLPPPVPTAPASAPQAVQEGLSSSDQGLRHKSATFRKNYDVLSIIGVGGGGTVYSGTRKLDNTQVAIKEVPKNKVKRWGKLNGRVVPIEFDLLHRATSTGHKGIIKMLDWFERRKSYILVMERPQPVIDLFDYLNQNGAVDEATARKIFLQLADSVLHCHANGVVHRDIKDENVLLNLHTQEAKLIDFGCGTVLKDTPYTEFAGTPEFYPPEWFTSKRYSGERVDAWSLAVLLYTMLEAEVPFSTEKNIVACDLKYKHPERLSSSCKSLLAWMLQKDVNKRPSLAQAMQHPWFKNTRNGTNSNIGVMATKELFSAVDAIAPINVQPSGHVIATTDSPISPQHNVEFNYNHNCT